MSQNNCTDCKYAIKTQVNDNNGKPVIGEFHFRCHRFPPSTTIIPTPQGIGQFTGFPRVDRTMFCSLFESHDGEADVLPFARHRLTDS